MSKSKKKSARMNAVHFQTLSSRYFRQIFSDVPTFLMLILQVPIMLLIVLAIYKKDCFVAPKQIGDMNTVMFVLIFIGGLMGLLNTYREITKERDVLSREIAGGLDPVSYVASKLFVQGVIALVQSLMLVGGSLLFIDFAFPNPLIGIPCYFLAVFLVILASASLGLMISAILKNSESAILPVLLIIIIQVVFCGALIPLSDALSYVGMISPVRWGLALFGKVLNFNEGAGWYAKDMYDTHVLVSIAALVISTLLCYIVTVTVIKGKNRKKS